jgi:hypothetical protein
MDSKVTDFPQSSPKYHQLYVLISGNEQFSIGTNTLGCFKLSYNRIEKNYVARSGDKSLSFQHLGG